MKYLLANKKKVFGRRLVFMLGELLSKAAPFFMLPIIARNLGPEAIYIYTSYIIAVFILQTLLSGWVTPYLSVCFFKSKKEFYGLTAILSTTYTSFALIPLLFLCLFYFSDGDTYLSIAALVGASSFFSSLIQLFMIQKQMSGDAITFSLINILRSFSFLLISCISIVFYEVSILYVVLIHMFIQFVIVVVFHVVYFQKLAKRALIKKNNNVKAALKFGLPMIPNLALNSLRTSLDRFFLGYIGTGLLVGLYSAAYQLATITMFILSGVLRTVIPDTLQALNDNNRGEILKQFKYLVVTMFCSSILISAFILFFGELLLGESFKGVDVFYLLPFLFFFQGLYDFFSIYYQHQKITNQILYISLTSLVIYGIFLLFSLNMSSGFFVYGILLAMMAQGVLIYCHKGKEIFDKSNF